MYNSDSLRDKRSMGIWIGLGFYAEQWHSGISSLVLLRWAFFGVDGMAGGIKNHC